MFGWKTGGLPMCALWLALGCNESGPDPKGDTEAVDSEVVDSEPGETELVDSEVEDTELVDTEVDDTEVVDTEVEDTELVDTEPVDTVVEDTEPVDTEPVDTEPVDTEPVDTVVVDTEVVDSEPGDSEVVDTEVVDTEPAAGDPVVDLNLGLYAAGSSATVESLHVVAVLSNGVYATRTGGGPWSSVFVQLTQSDAALMYIDRIIRVVGVVRATSVPWGTLYSLDASVPGTSAVQTGNTAGPPPQSFTIAQAVDDDLASPSQGALVRIQAPRVWEDGSGGYRVGDGTTNLFVSRAVLVSGERTYGDTMDELYGVLAWRNARWELLPRRPGDVVGLMRYQTAADQLSYGELVVSELMEVPGAACGSGATGGQYIEIYNAAGRSIDLDGLIYFDYSTNRSAQVRASVPVAPGARAVTFVAGDNNCYGLSTDLPITPSLNGTGNFVGLYNHNIALDELQAASFPRTAGVAHELSESALDADDNDQGANWCAASRTIPGSADRGTPGLTNDCP